MIKGYANIDFVTDDMLLRTKFEETTEVGHANGLWEELLVSPPLYPIGSATIYQSFGNKCPKWAQKIKTMFDDKIKYSTITINLVKPGNFIPSHKDKFYRLLEFAKNNNLDLTNKEPIRINLFLQDHKIGHFFEMDNKVCMNYKKGDYVIIKPNKVHSVINIGNENRYTLQVSGFADKDTFI